MAKIWSYIYGAQLEQQSYATSYIPTAGATVSRIAESASKTGLASYINSSEGVLYFEGSILSDEGVLNDISINDNTTSVNRLIMSFSNGVNNISGRFDSSGSDVTLNASGYDLESNHKIALVYKLNNISLWVDGVKEDSSSSFTVFSDLQTLDFSNPFSGGVNIFNGNCKDLRVYKTALTDSELTTLTTI